MGSRRNRRRVKAKAVSCPLGGVFLEGRGRVDRSIGVSSWVAFTTIGIGIAVSATFKDDDDDDDACRVVSRRVVRGYRDVV